VGGAGANAAGGAAGAINPDTGLPNGGAGTGTGAGGQLYSTQLGAAASHEVLVGEGIDSSFEHALMVLAAVLLLIATVGPPLLTRYLNRRKQS
jgi:hypothetical protein